MTDTGDGEPMTCWPNFNSTKIKYYYNVNENKNI